MNEYEALISGVLDLSSGANIPNDPGNRHWLAYQEWLNAGNTPRPLKPSLFHTWNGSTWVEDTATKEAAQDTADIEKLEKVDRAVLRLFMSLTEALLGNGTISGSDFSAEEAQLYQQVKSLKGKIW